MLGLKVNLCLETRLYKFRARRRILRFSLLVLSFPACKHLSTDATDEDNDEDEETIVADAVTNTTKLSSLLRGILLDDLKGNCNPKIVTELVRPKRAKNSFQKSIAYGSLFGSLIVIGSQFGGLLYPLRNHIAYKITLT